MVVELHVERHYGDDRRGPRLFDISWNKRLLHFAFGLWRPGEYDTHGAKVERGRAELREIVDSRQQIVFDFAVFESLERSRLQEQCVQRNCLVIGQISVSSTRSFDRRCPDNANLAGPLTRRAIEFESAGARSLQSMNIALRASAQVVKPLKRNSLSLSASDALANLAICHRHAVSIFPGYMPPMVT